MELRLILLAVEVVRQLLVDKNIAALQTTANGQPSGATITNTPVGYVQVMVNGVQQWLGDGIKTASCYFSADGGVTAKSYIRDSGNRCFILEWFYHRRISIRSSKR
jgi:hypothetical protein